MPRQVRRLLVLIALVSVGCGAPLTSEWKRLEPSVPAADFTLEQLDGGPVSLQDYRGRIVVMEFWATWCGPCRMSTPSLEVVYKRFRERGVAVLLVNAGEEPATVRKWAERRFTAPILIDQNGRVGRLYKVQGIPSLFILDQAGQIVYAESGYGGGLERNLTLILEELLKAPADADHG